MPLTNIKDITKQYNAVIFDNSIELYLKDESTLFFTSFVSRNECYRLILKMMKRSKFIEGKELIKLHTQENSENQ